MAGARLCLACHDMLRDKVLALCAPGAGLWAAEVRE